MALLRYNIKLTSNQVLILFFSELITADLRRKVFENPALSRKLKDPRLLQVLNDMSNKKDSPKTLAGDPEMRDMLKDFTGVLGEHFIDLGEEEMKKKVSLTCSFPFVCVYLGGCDCGLFVWCINVCVCVCVCVCRGISVCCDCDWGLFV